MKVAILRARASVPFKGDFGLAGVVIGYTYKCLFLPLPYILFKAARPPPPPPMWSPSFLPLQPLNMITFLAWVMGEESKQWNQEKVIERDDWKEKNSCNRWKKNKCTDIHICTLAYSISFSWQGRKAKQRKNTKNVIQTVTLISFVAIHIHAQTHTHTDTHALAISFPQTGDIFSPPLQFCLSSCTLSLRW